MVFIEEESSKRRVNAYIPKYISMAYYIMFLWIPGRDETRSKLTGNFLVNALLDFYRVNRRYHARKYGKHPPYWIEGLRRKQRCISLIISVSYLLYYKII